MMGQAGRFCILKPSQAQLFITDQCQVDIWYKTILLWQRGVVRGITVLGTSFHRGRQGQAMRANTELAKTSQTKRVSTGVAEASWAAGLTLSPTVTPQCRHPSPRDPKIHRRAQRGAASTAGPGDPETRPCSTRLFPQALKALPKGP